MPSSTSIYLYCRFATVLHVMEVAFCHECLYIGVCKSTVCIQHIDNLMLLDL